MPLNGPARVLCALANVREGKELHLAESCFDSAYHLGHDSAGRNKYQ